jgi:hypothetical protein
MSYITHNQINVGSDHRLLTFKVQICHKESSWSWDETTPNPLKWDPDKVDSFKRFLNSKETVQSLKNIIDNTNGINGSHTKETSKRTIDHDTKTLLDILKKGITLSNTTPQRVKQTSKTTRNHVLPKETQDKLNKLIMKKQTLLSLLPRQNNNHKTAKKRNDNNTTQKKAQADIWTKINSIQKEIKEISSRTKFEEDSEWWRELQANPHSPDSKIFWIYATPLLPNKSKQPPFPTIMRNEKNELLTKKTDILNHIAGTYIDISQNKDPVAQSHYASTNQQPPIYPDHNTTHSNGVGPAGTSGGKTDHNRDKLSLQELQFAIKKAKNGKKPGKDGLTSEYLKVLPELALEALLAILNRMWILKYTPTDWKVAQIKLHYKNGARDSILNYRPITLLQALFKIWERILEQRARKLVLNLYPNPLQMGSQKDNSSHAATIMTKGIHLLVHSQDKSVLSASIDMNKAYNRVNRNKLWLILENMGIHNLLLQAIINTYTDAMDFIKIGNTTSEPFHLKAGLRQGSILSPLLYILYTSSLLDALQKTQTGVTIITPIGTTNIPAVMFVDDLQTFSTNVENTITQLTVINTFVEETDSIINTKKSSISTSTDIHLLKNIL